MVNHQITLQSRSYAKNPGDIISSQTRVCMLKLQSPGIGVSAQAAPHVGSSLHSITLSPYRVSNYFSISQLPHSSTQTLPIPDLFTLYFS